MAGLEDHSEYEGGGVMPNGVFPKGNDALTPSDKLLLTYTTGQTEDSRAPLAPGVFNGAVMPDHAKIAQQAQRERNQRTRAHRRSEAERYRETRY